MNNNDNDYHYQYKTIREKSQEKVNLRNQ